MRIIAGTLRGRKLEAPEGLVTRPTSDRIKESWFNIIGPMEGRVLDLYAGTGALGFEALSRGCEHAVFVERDRKACKMIQHNARRIGVLDKITVVENPVENARKRIERDGPYQFILSDPPWTLWEEVERTLKRTLKANLLKADGQLVVGAEKGTLFSLGEASGFIERKNRSWGRAAASFFIRQAEEEQGEQGEQEETESTSAENPWSLDEPAPADE